MLRIQTKIFCYAVFMLKIQHGGVSYGADFQFLPIWGISTNTTQPHNPSKLSITSLKLSVTFT